MVEYGQHEWLIAVGEKALSFGGTPFDELYNHWEENRDWLFGQLAYDLKNTVEDLESNNPDHHQNPDIHFFIPETVFEFDGKQLGPHFCHQWRGRPPRTNSRRGCSENNRSQNGQSRHCLDARHPCSTTREPTTNYCN